MSQILYFASTAKAVGVFGSSDWSYPQDPQPDGALFLAYQARGPCG
jgi:hypothetical protein